MQIWCSCWDKLIVCVPVSKGLQGDDAIRRRNVRYKPKIVCGAPANRISCFIFFMRACRPTNDRAMFAGLDFGQSKQAELQTMVQLERSVVVILIPLKEEQPKATNVIAASGFWGAVTEASCGALRNIICDEKTRAKVAPYLGFSYNISSRTKTKTSAFLEF